jgi:hypothetical protein
MMTEMKKSRSLSHVVVLGAAAFGLLVTGCGGPECVDRFDCQNNKAPLGAGKQYVCEANTCVVRDITPETPGTGSDAGTDAGTEPETDAGTEPETDAGTEPTSCADLSHDAQLGTLQLQPGFSVVESAPLPEHIGAITAVADAEGSYTLYGLNSDESVYALGTWPEVAASTTPLYPIVPAGVAQAYVGSYLVSDGVRLMGGYTLADFSGKVAIHEPESDTPAHVSATGNFSAVGLDGAFLINGLGLEGVSGTGIGVYALKTQSAPFQASKLATFPSAGTFSGFSALATNKIVALGYAYSTPVPGNDYASTNALRAVSPDTYASALTEGTTLDLAGANTPEIYSGLDLRDAAGFGAGVALKRSPSSDDYTNTRDVARIALTPTQDGSGVTVGQLQEVLTQGNTCTKVVTMAPLAEDLLVGVQDKNGRRLVRLHAGTP